MPDTTVPNAETRIARLREGIEELEREYNIPPRDLAAENEELRAQVARLEQRLRLVRSACEALLHTTLKDDRTVEETDDVSPAGVRAFAVLVAGSSGAMHDSAMRLLGRSVECAGCGATGVDPGDRFHQPDDSGSYPCCVGDRESFEAK